MLVFTDVDSTTNTPTGEQTQQANFTNKIWQMRSSLDIPDGN